MLLLTNRYTISAGETFTLAMHSFNQVTQMGDTTTGAFSDAVGRELPNGWMFSLGDRGGVSELYVWSDPYE
ncbi:MAG: S41 family peptidase [Cyclobacteriaceae bacterium]